MEQKKILIVEDEQELREAIVVSLGQEGFEMLSAADGKSGLALALDAHPDLILLDIVMPHMDGLEMLKALRQDPWGKEVPVIVMTVVDDINTMAEFVTEGTHDYILKNSVSLKDVAKKVKDKLRIS